MKRSWTRRLLGVYVCGCAAVAGCATAGHKANTSCNFDTKNQVVQQRPDVLFGPYQYPVIAANQGPPTEFATAQVAKAPKAPAALPAQVVEEARPIQTVSAVQEIKAPRETKAHALPSEGPVVPAVAHVAAQAPYANAPDYTWLCGELQQSRGVWRLRYAPVDAVDDYGGSVTLTGDAVFDGHLRDGEFVRVQGRLVASDERTPAPLYQVDAVTPLR